MTADTTWNDRSDADDAEFAEVLAKFDAAPAAEESLRERVADALEPFTPFIRGLLRREFAREMADAAIAVMRGE